MKQVVGIFYEIFLFCFLLLIFIIPLLVSLNLDPRLLNVQRPQVAGIIDTTSENSNHYRIEEEIIATNGLKLIDSDRYGNYYLVKFRTNPKVDLNEELKIGRLSNDSASNIEFSVKLYSDINSDDDFNAFMLVGKRRFDLLERGNFLDTEFSIPGGNREEIAFFISSDISVNYPVEFKIDIRSVSKSI